MRKKNLQNISRNCVTLKGLICRHMGTYEKINIWKSKYSSISFSTAIISVCAYTHINVQK